MLVSQPGMRFSKASQAKTLLTLTMLLRYALQDCWLVSEGFYRVQFCGIFFECKAIWNILNFNHTFLIMSMSKYSLNKGVHQKLSAGLIEWVVCVHVNLFFFCQFAYLLIIFSCHRSPNYTTNMLPGRRSDKKVRLHSSIVSWKPHDWDNLFRLASPSAISGNVADGKH